MGIVYQKDKRSGITYVYESKAFWDKEKKQSRSKRTLLGRLDEKTEEIIPTDGRGKKRSPNYVPAEGEFLIPSTINELKAALIKALEENAVLKQQIDDLKSKKKQEIPMTKDEAYEKQRCERISLQRRVDKLEAIVDSYNKGTYESTDKIDALKKISKLTQENTRLKNECKRYKSNWENQVRITENFRVAASDADYAKEDLLNELTFYKNQCKELQNRLNTILNVQSSENETLKAQVEALKDALKKESAKANTDGTNSSLPTSQTPIDKKKVIPNSREKTNRNRGAQPGHEKHSLSPLFESEITESENHTLEKCPDCQSSSLIFLEKREKDVIDYEVRLIKKRHYFYAYQCSNCGHIVHSPIPLELKEPIQYGASIKSLGLSLLDIGYVSINRVQKILNGFLGNDINISEGYICSLQKKHPNNYKISQKKFACNALSLPFCTGMIL